MNGASRLVRFHPIRNRTFQLYHTSRPICNHMIPFSCTRLYSTNNNIHPSSNSSAKVQESSPSQQESQPTPPDNKFGLDSLFPNPEDQSRKMMEEKMKQLLDEEVKPDPSDRVFPKPFIRFYNTAALIALLILSYGFWNAKQAEARGEKPPNYDAKLRVYEKQIEKIVQSQAEELGKHNLELNDIKKQIEEEMKQNTKR